MLRVKWHILKLLKIFFLWRHPYISIGHHSYGIPIVLFGDLQKNTRLKIGNFCSLPHKRVLILLGGEHYHNWVSTYPLNMNFPSYNLPSSLRSKGDVVIGNDVWFGVNTTILSGVTIGDGAIIGANSLVVDNIPPYAVVGGNPAKIIRYRFSKETIKLLLQIKWWNWTERKIKDASHLIMQPNIDQFVKQYLHEKINS